MVARLLQWREGQCPSEPDPDVKGWVLSSTPEAGERRLVPPGDPKAQKRYVAVNFALARAIITVLDGRAASADDKLCRTLIVLSLRHFGVEECGFHSDVMPCAVALSDIFTEVLGVLSKTR